MLRQDALAHAKDFHVNAVRQRIAALDNLKTATERKLVDLEFKGLREGGLQQLGGSALVERGLSSLAVSVEVRRENLRATLKSLKRERAAAHIELAIVSQGHHADQS